MGWDSVGRVLKEMFVCGWVVVGGERVCVYIGCCEWRGVGRCS